MAVLLIDFDLTLLYTILPLKTMDNISVWDAQKEHTVFFNASDITA